MTELPRVLFVDHHDSFSGNLVAALRMRGCHVDSVLSSPRKPEAEATPDFSASVDLDEHDALVLSPGPGRPQDYMSSLMMLQKWPRSKPLLGVCLGHQLLLSAEGAPLSLVSSNPVHGRRELIQPLQTSQWLEGFEIAGSAIFYNSWAVRVEDCNMHAQGWRLLARNDSFAAACEHDLGPWLGVQYHPESFASEHGGRLLDAFVALLRSRVSMSSRI